MPAGYTLVSASHLTDASGAVLNGTIRFTPTTTNGVPVAFQINGTGQSIRSAVTAQVVLGAFSINLADTSLTTPQNICYDCQVFDQDGGLVLGGSDSGYEQFQPAGSAFDFDTYVPAAPALAVVQPPVGTLSATGLLATVAISAFTAVSTGPGGFIAADASDITKPAIGIASEGANIGGAPSVQYAGTMTYIGWNWIPEVPVFVGAGGMLTQVPVSTGFSQVVGVPLTPTLLLVTISQPIRIL